MCFPFFFLDLVNVYFCVVFRITFAKVQPCASDVKYFAIFFLFSQYYSLTLHSQRFATLPLETPYRGAVRLKGNGVRVPDCPAAVSRPYLRARTREPLKPCISVPSAWVWQDAIPSYKALCRMRGYGKDAIPSYEALCRMRGYGKDAIPSYALGRCSRLGGESEDLPKLICRWSHRCAPRGLGAYDRNTYII